MMYELILILCSIVCIMYVGVWWNDIAEQHCYLRLEIAIGQISIQ